MRKIATLAAVFLTLMLLSATFASAWTVRGNVYISDSRPAACVPVELYYGDDCTGDLIWGMLTDDEGYFEFSAMQDTVWVKMIFGPPVSCEYCTNWGNCTSDTQCKEATSEDTWPLAFDLEQPNCECLYP